MTATMDETRPHPAASTPLVAVRHVSKQFANDTLAVRDVDLELGAGEFISLLGPSGCGKSTLLRMIAGLGAPSSGTITWPGETGAAQGSAGHGARDLGFVFQDPTLMPWANALANVMLPLKIVQPFRSRFAREKRGAFRDKAHALLSQVGLKGFAGKYPWQLSGGMLQRANLCRALIHEPRLLLLDEPFGALDQFTREELWAILQELWLAHRPTVLLVTHDLREAGFLASRICVMSARPGRILDDSAVAFARPRTIAMTFEADFVALNQRLRALIVDARSAPVLEEGI